MTHENGDSLPEDSEGVCINVFESDLLLFDQFLEGAD
jgi:hypothetical protein